MVDFRTVAILPASGGGERTGLNVPKQYCNIVGRPLIAHTLECFQRITWIERIIVAISPDWDSFMQKLVQRYGFTKVELVYGGASRHHSIRNCVWHLRDQVLRRGKAAWHEGARNGEPVVILHDAVRPFAKEDILKRVALAADEHAAAGSVLGMVSTVIESDFQNTLVQSLERAKLKESHTPQAFRWSVLETAYQKISEHDLDHGTEVLDLVLKHTGHRAKLVQAPDSVWKVTYKKDLTTAEFIVKEQSSVVFLLDTEPSTNGTLSQLQRCLSSYNLKVSVTASVPDHGKYLHTTIVLHLDKPKLEDATVKCEQQLDDLVSSSSSTGLLVCMCHLPDADDMTVGLYRRLVKRLAAKGKPEEVYVFLVVYTTAQTKEEQTPPQVCEMTASLIFDRNPLLSGQLFICD